MDLVRSKTDFGQYTDDVDEFLTCVNMSDTAFRELTEYFETVDRPVIVCMVGDHAPAFAQELTTDRDTETVFRLRSTPFVIWSNFDMDISVPENTCMPMLAPKVLEAANLPLSPFYNYMLKLCEDVPVITANGLYKDKDGKTYSYTEQSPYTDSVNLYMDLVYNNVSEKANRIDKLFKLSDSQPK